MNRNANLNCGSYPKNTASIPRAEAKKKALEEFNRLDDDGEDPVMERCLICYIVSSRKTAIGQFFFAPEKVAPPMNTVVRGDSGRIAYSSGSLSDGGNLVAWSLTGCEGEKFFFDGYTVLEVKEVTK